jgi:predicted PurR-regulated permease PerM
LAGIFLIGVFYTLHFARDLILPILLALFLAVVLQPIVNHLHRLRVPESIGSAVVVLLLVSLLAAGIYQLSSPLAEWLDRGPMILNQISDKLYPLGKTIEEAKETTDKLEELADLQKGDRKVIVKGPSLAQLIVGQAGSFTLTAVIVLLLLFFFMAFGSTSIRRLVRDFNGTSNDTWVVYFSDIRREVGVYLQTLSLINIGLGLTTTILMAVLGMPNPMLWGTMAAILHLVPYLGGLVMTSIIAIVSALTFDSWVRILMPPLLYALLNGLEGEVIWPLIMGKRLTLNPAAVFLSVLIWGWLWGPIGVLMAVPILVALKTVADREENLKFIRGLVGRARQ